ncbi:MAG: 2-oxo acid dehydrogenase subunit E2 [Psittacicella sp.]
MSVIVIPVNSTNIKIEKWNISIGDNFKEGEFLLSIIQDGTFQFIQAEKDGILLDIYLHDGEYISKDEPVARVLYDDENESVQTEDEIQNPFAFLNNNPQEEQKEVQYNTQYTKEIEQNIEPTAFVKTSTDEIEDSNVSLSGSINQNSEVLFSEVDISSILKICKKYAPAVYESQKYELTPFLLVLKAIFATLKSKTLLEIDDMDQSNLVIVDDRFGLTFEEIAHNSLNLYDIASKNGVHQEKNLLSQVKSQDNTLIFSLSDESEINPLFSIPLVDNKIVASLAIHKAHRKIELIHNEYVKKDMLYLALGINTALIEKRKAYHFLEKIRKNIEEPIRILLDL